MNWKTTWILIASAGLLFGFIYFIEQHRKGTADADAPPPKLLALKPSEVSVVQIRRTNQFLLRAERTNNAWNLTAPVVYGAQFYAIEGFLQGLANLQSHTFISGQELAATKRSIAEYGLDVPLATVTLQHNGQRVEILFGAKTPVGDQRYVQVLNSPGVHVVNTKVFEALPLTANEWRDPTLLSMQGLNFDRFEVRSAGRGFAVQFDGTNRLFLLTKPTPARANTPRIGSLIDTIRGARIKQFVSDDSREDLNALGLQPAETELVFGVGTNDIALFQFGKSPTNDASLVYARRADRPTIMLVPKSLVDALQVPSGELRDRKLLSFAASSVDTLEISTQGAEPFAVRRQFNGTWVVMDAQATQADADTMRECFEKLGKLEGSIEKDVVTDFAAYGLAPAARTYYLKSTFTNANGQVTNRIVAQLELSGIRDGTILARGADDKSVYRLSVADLTGLPYAAWQLRDRRVWSFTTNQVIRLAIRHNGYTRQYMRNANGGWALAPGSEGIIVPEAVDEALYRLGQLRAAQWVARGDDQKTHFGFTGEKYKMVIDLKNGEKPHTLALEFGGQAASLYPYAMASVDGQNWIFEFPIQLYLELMRYLGNPTPMAENKNR